jgi:hypothetical protein
VIDSHRTRQANDSILRCASDHRAGRTAHRRPRPRCSRRASRGAGRWRSRIHRERRGLLVVPRPFSRAGAATSSARRWPAARPPPRGDGRSGSDHPSHHRGWTATSIQAVRALGRPLLISAEAAGRVKRSPSGPSAASCEAVLLTLADSGARRCGGLRQEPSGPAMRWPGRPMDCVLWGQHAMLMHWAGLPFPKA